MMTSASPCACITGRDFEPEIFGGQAEARRDRVHLGRDLDLGLDVERTVGLDGRVVDRDLGIRAADDHRDVEAQNRADDVARDLVQEADQIAGETLDIGRRVVVEVGVLGGGRNLGRAAADRRAVDIDLGALVEMSIASSPRRLAQSEAAMVILPAFLPGAPLRRAGEASPHQDRAAAGRCSWCRPRW